MSMADDDDDDDLDEFDKARIITMGREITYANLECLCVRYHRKHAIVSDQLEVTLAAMHKDGWRFCLQIIKEGIPETYYELFTAAIHKKPFWTAERFNSMRMPVTQRKKQDA